MTRGLLCRSILVPKCVRDDVFDIVALMLLVKVDEHGTVYALSLGSRFLLRDVDGAHGYGMRTADNSNNGYAARNGSPPPLDKKTFYLGFYDIMKNELKQIPTAQYDVHVRHRIEHGEIAHFQLELTNKGLLGAGKKNDKERRRDRQTAMEAAVKLLRGPKVYWDAINDPELALPDDFSLPCLPPEDSDGNSIVLSKESIRGTG